MAGFVPLVMEQAKNSLLYETECHQFDVCLGEKDEVFLYETYTDETAFKNHLKTAHFVDFENKTKGLIMEKTVKTYHLANKNGF